MKIIRVGVTGGRDYPDKVHVWRSLDITKSRVELAGATMTLVVGDATGADQHAFFWAAARGVTREFFVAEWKRFGNAAGPARNKRMLDSGIDYLCAFPGGAGTANMKEICRKANVYVKEFSDK